MLYNKFNPKKLLEGLKICRDFALSELSYEHIISGKTDHIVKIVPQELDFSLLARFSNVVQIENGALLKQEEFSDSSMSISMYSTGKVVSGIHMGIHNPPLTSKNGLIRKVKPTLLKNFPLFVNFALSSKVEDNKGKLRAKGSSDIYIEDKPELLSISEDIIKKLEELSIEIYGFEKVIENSISLTKENTVHIFSGNEGAEIIEYKDDTILSVSFKFINDNQSLEELYIIERYKNGVLKEGFEKDILKKVKAEIQKYMFLNDLKSGNYKVVLMPDASNVFFHEAFAAHLLSGTYISQQISTIFEGRIGEVFDSLKGINLIMDPTLDGKYGSYKYDHEGNPSQRVTLLENGVVTDYLTDNNSATSLEIKDKDDHLVSELTNVPNIDDLLLKYVPEKHLLRHFSKKEEQLQYLLDKYLLSDVIKDSGVDISLDWRSDRSRLIRKSNGHSRVQWWVGSDSNGILQPILSEARMSNLIIENTNNDQNIDILEKARMDCISEGRDFFLVVNSTSGEIDVENGTFIITVDYMIKIYVDDRKTEVINPGSFSMSLENFLKKIDYIDHNFDENNGSCGAQSGFVPVGSITPSILISEMPYQAAPKQDVVDDAINEILITKDL